MARVRVKPLPNRIVIHPESGWAIKEEGEEVNMCPQIKRYIKFGDLEIVTQKTKTIRKK